MENPDFDNPFLSPSSDQYIFLFFHLILTISIPPFLLYTTESSLITLIFYFLFIQLCLCSVYAVFLVSGKRTINYYLTGETDMKQNQYYLTIILSLIAFALHFLFGWLICNYFIDDEKQKILVQFAGQNTERSILIFLMVLLLPLCEELFWRVYFAKSYPRNVFFYGINCFAYGIMHFFIFLIFSNAVISTLTGIYYVILGGILIYLKRMIRVGGVIGIHLGINAGVVLAMHLFLTPLELGKDFENGKLK